MRRGDPFLSRTFALAVLALMIALPAFAASKLDPRIRTAVARLQSGEAVSQMLESAASITSSGMVDAFITGSVTRAELEALGVIVRTSIPGIHTAYIPADVVESVAALPEVLSIRGAAPVELELDISVPTTSATANRGPAPTFTGYNGAGVLVGDVDSGIDESHGDFDDAAGNTRIINIWDQTNGAGPSPAGYGYGTEWGSVSIDNNTCTQVNLDGHGTHVMGIAAGDGSQTAGVTPQYTYAGMAPMADIMMVNTTLQTTDILDGVSYIFDRATALGKNSVVNISLGSHFGPHDGTSPFEVGLSSLTGPGRVICKSAGNERGQARHAEVFAAGTGTNATMTLAGSATGRLFAIDGYYEATEDLNVQITTPNGTIVGPVSLGNISAAFPGTVTANGRVYLENGVALTATGDKEVYIEISAAAGQTMNGTWTFRFIPVTLGAANGEVDLWRFFNSTGTTANFVIGNQATEELVSEPGNAVDLITVAAYTSKRFWTDCNGNTTVNFNGSTNPGTLAGFSSPGPTRDGRQKPDIAAPGTAIVSARSFDQVVNCPASPGASTLVEDLGNHIVNAGTSMAAPHATGAVALMMQKYGAITPAFAKAFLTARAAVDANTGAVWNKDWGFGKLNVRDLIDPLVTVLSPNGAEVLFFGQNVNLTWNASDNLSVASVNIEISRDNGGSWSPIAVGVPNTGTFPWTVTAPASNLCLIRVTAADGWANTGFDTSDLVFAILDGATATQMRSFTALSRNGAVEVSWQLADESLMSSSVLERSDASTGTFTAIAADKRFESGVMTVIDRTVEAGHTYWYRVRVTDNGSVQTFGPVQATSGTAVLEFALSRPVPNPSNGVARMSFALPQMSQVSVSIHDVQGREIASLANGTFQAGQHNLTWNGATNGGRAAAGLYFVRMSVPGRAPINQRLVVTQ
ncbi:MAG: S8 family serine peptidase [Candidatus Eisenbacteria bacterium]|uniref:S8 family serine peptidase n=1 Tax=Eiseniibacteriota bacterium TaxID=2212470 RepID=A0A849SIC9_UNCEI|nr:S8 family serine peptidase [Candidatus Eisenbacteria bacterium]